MCQIIALKTTTKKLKKILKVKPYTDLLQNTLEDKGGDYFGAALITKAAEKFITNHPLSIKQPLNDISNFIFERKIEGEIQILLFSRQQPEMENGLALEQPYSHNNGEIFAVHGTISNDKELAKELNINIKADTEILRYLNKNEWPLAEGTFCAININTNSKPTVYNNGLKVWSEYLVHEDKVLARLWSTTELNFLSPSIEKESVGLKFPKTLFVSFSGGMDIALSTYKMLSTQKYNKLVLNYFAWGSIAEANEMIVLEKFKDFYGKEFDIPVEIEIWQADRYFDEYFKMNSAGIPKISKHNPKYTGEKAETESPIAYVPYRNTQFAILLASKAEALNLINTDLLFGLNLSEGMVYMDNSEGWLESISNVVKYGGKDFKLSGTYNVVAPYFMRTKTNMLKEFKDSYGEAALKKLLLISTSCYNPNADGSPCGECGSCILREKALNNLGLKD